MALDSRDKRASALGFPGVVFSNPDGSLTIVGDRQQAVGLYRGIAAAAVIGLDTGIAEIVAGIRMDTVAGIRAEVVAGLRMEIVGG